MPHTETPKGHFWTSLFYLFTCYFYPCIRPSLVLCLALWNSSCVTRHLGLCPQRLMNRTGYKHINVCKRSMWLRWLTNLPPVFLTHFCCTTLRCSSGRETAPQCANKTTLNSSVSGVRPRTTTRSGLGIQHVVGQRSNHVVPLSTCREEAQVG